MRFLVLGLVALSLIACGQEAVRHDQPPSPYVVGKITLPKDPITVVVHQRRREAIPGSRGRAFIRLGDITGGQVMFSVISSKGKIIIDAHSVQFGQVITYDYDDTLLFIRVEKLVNFLVGDDYAEFVISHNKLKPKKTVPKPLPESWKEEVK